MLKVYMDETGVHEGSPTVAVSAYIARPKTWRAWTKAWNLAKRPIKVFHATDCANCQGEFVGWTNDKRDPFVAKLLKVLPAHLIAGLVIAIQMDDFKKALTGREDLVEMVGNPYTCCFQWSITTIVELANQYGRPERGESIAFVHEVNDFKGEALKTFDYVKQFHNPKGTKLSLTLGSKADYPPLQAADVLAYEGGKFLRDPEGKPRRAWTALDPNNTRIVARRYGKENMPALISDLTTFREKLLASGWDGKVV
jgi:hypothetical protein